MNTLLYYFASSLIFIIRSLPLEGVARVGRFFGGLFYYLDARHRRVARRNLRMCFPEKSEAEVRALAKENFRRIGESFLCPVKMIFMTDAQRMQHVDLQGREYLEAHERSGTLRNVIMAVGHFGNFELLAYMGKMAPSHRRATTYRAIRNPAGNRLLLKLRAENGCRYYERRSEGAALREALGHNNLLLGLLCDQHSGDHGLRLPFLGHDCTTSKAPAVFALRYNAPLHVAITYRTRLAFWHFEISPEIPTYENGQPRALADIMRDVNTVFEAAVRRDPANWFWVHNRWKKAKVKTVAPKADDERLQLQ